VDITFNRTLLVDLCVQDTTIIGMEMLNDLWKRKKETFNLPSSTSLLLQINTAVAPSQLNIEISTPINLSQNSSIKSKQLH
jgi:hypothetical protein